MSGALARFWRHKGRLDGLVGIQSEDDNQHDDRSGT